jgi:citrate synthase
MLTHHSLIHEDMISFFEKYPSRAHPMGIVSSMVNALGAFYPDLQDPTEKEEIKITFARLLSKLRTLAAVSYNISVGHKVIYPCHDLSYCANFLNMMFDSPVKPYMIDDDIVQALNVFWILHADHEQNCSTTAVKLIGSDGVNIYAAISAGINALWGPMHGGGNQAVVEML